MIPAGATIGTDRLPAAAGVVGRKMKTSPRTMRSVARVLLFDEQGRLLLLFDPDPEQGGYWYTPGGRIEPGESPEEAARRELVEELGLDVPNLGPVVLRRRARFTYGGRRLDQDEWHLLGRVVSPVVGPGRAGDAGGGGCGRAPLAVPL